MTHRSHMNPQKRRTIGKYRVAEDHYCQGVKQRTSSLSGKEWNQRTYQYQKHIQEEKKHGEKHQTSGIRGQT